MNQRQIVELERRHVMQTYARGQVVVERGSGSYVFDGSGKRYLDFTSGIATAPLGHANRELAREISAQARRLINITNLYYTEPQVRLATALSKLAGFGTKAFFSNSGAEANEAAIKLARKHTGRRGIIAARNAFHGRTAGALSATWKKSYRQPFKPLVPGFGHVPYNNIPALKKAVGEKTAAFIVEPIQGEAGVVVPDKGYLRDAAKVCRKAGALLIVDEVQTNMRTGKFFAFQHDRVRPDIVTVAKGIAGGLPLGATIAKKRVADSFSPGDHGCTFGGNSLSCAAANKTIEIVKREKLIENASKQGRRLMSGLQEIANSGSAVKEVRGKGLMVGVELKKPMAKTAVAECVKNRLLATRCNERVLRFLPALTVSRKEVDAGIAVLNKVL